MTQQAGLILGQLAAAASEQDRSTAIAVIRNHMTACGTGPEIWQWATHLNALMPTASEREAAAEVLVSRLADIPVGRYGDPMLAARELQPTGEQRRKLVDYLLTQIGLTDSVDLRISLCEMATWFSPAPAARAAVAAALLDAAQSPPVPFDRQSVFSAALVSLPFAEEERQEMIDRLIRRIPSEDIYTTILCANLIIEAGPAAEQRTRTAQVLVTRLNEAADTGELDRLVRVLENLDAQTDWRVPAKDLVVATLPAASLHEILYAWADLLPGLALSDSDRGQLIDAFIQHLRPGTLDLDIILALLDELRPTPAQETAIVDRLINMMSENRASAAAETARALLERPQTLEQRNAIVRVLIQHVTRAKPEDLAVLLNVAAAYPLSSDERSILAARAVRLPETSNSEVRSPETRITDDMAALPSIKGMNVDTRNHALKLVLDKIAQLGIADAPVAEQLLQLGFDAAALTDFAYRYREERNIENVLRDLANILRHNCSPASWKASLGQLADCHPPPR